MSIIYMIINHEQNYNVQRTGEVRAYAYLLQSLSVAIQRGNAISLLGSIGADSD